MKNSNNLLKAFTINLLELTESSKVGLP